MKQKVAVLGAGTMGHCICACFAMGGHDVNLYDITQEFAENGLRSIRMDLDVMVKLEYILRRKKMRLSRTSP